MRRLAIYLIAVATIGATIAAAAVTRQTVVGCPILGTRRETIGTHQAWAMQYFAYEWPNLNVVPRLIGVNEVSSTPREVTRAFVLQGSDCDIVYGPGLSSIVTTMNPLIDQLWIDGSSASDDFSEKLAYPLFNRIVLATKQTTRSSADMVVRMGWMRMNMLCAENAIGRAVFQGFTDAYRELGGKIEESYCTSEFINTANMTKILEQVIKSPVKMVFVGIVHTDPAYISFAEAAINLRADEHVQFVFWEGPCTGSNFDWKKLKGSICATYEPDPQVQTLTMNAYYARDTRWELSEFARLNYPLTYYAPTRTGTYQLLAIDAVRATLRAYNNFVGEFNRKPRNASEITAYFRRSRLDNFTLTGAADFLPNGDRVSAKLSVLNAFPSANNDTQIIGRITEGALNFTGTPIYFNTIKEYRAYNQAPPSYIEPARDSVGSSSNSNSTVAAVVASLAVVAIAVIVLMAVLRKSSSRDLACAPKDASQPFAMAFTDIQASTTLWAKCPELMGPAVDTHHRLIRELIRQYKGYEVKTIGDSFMVAFQDVKLAAQFAVALQDAFYNENFGTHAFDDIVRAKVANDDGLKLDNELYAEVWNGLRVRVGVHYGTGSIQLDPVTQGYDYYGTVVNTAARVEGVAHGGQVLLTTDAYLALASACGGEDKLETTLVPGGVVAKSLGPQPLRGLPAPIVLYQVLPASLARREFPPLRLDVETTVDEGNKNEDGGVPRTPTSTSQGDRSLDSARARDDLLLTQCQAAAGAYGHAHQQAHAQRLWVHAKLVSMLVAPARRQQQVELLTAVAKLWRVTVPEKKHHDVFVARTAALLASRIAPAVEEAQRSGFATNDAQQRLPSRHVSASPTPRMTVQAPLSTADYGQDATAPGSVPTADDESHSRTNAQV